MLSYLEQTVAIVTSWPQDPIGPGTYFGQWPIQVWTFGGVWSPYRAAWLKPCPWGRLRLVHVFLHV